MGSNAVPHCIKDTEGWEIKDEVWEAAVGKPDVTVMDKPTFGSVDLAAHLSDYAKDRSLDQVTLIGICTDICVISNALLLKAFNPEIEITVISDICAGVTPAKHLAALETMKSCQINVIKEGASL